MTALRQSGFLRRLAALAPVALLSAALATPASGQVNTPRNVLLSDDGVTAPKVLAPRTKFGLFALGDLGVSGMRMTGTHGWHVTSYGPCGDGFLVGQCGDVFAQGGFATAAWRFHLFGVQLIAGAGPSTRNKIAQVFPGISGATGGGYVGHKNLLLLTGRVDIAAADGTAGRIFSGVTSTDDNSCRDFSDARNGYVSTGFALLAGSDCPETWGSQGFQGPRVDAESAYVALRGPAANPNFAFDWWRIPAEYQAQAEPAGSFSTYGAMSDYFSDNIEAYGNITKMGADAGFGAPRRTGYPLGLDYKFEVFKYDVPAIQNAVFYRLLVINNSARVYGGNGVDYDSLYMGLSPEFGRNQNGTGYWVPSRNAYLSNENGTNPGCNGAIQAPGTPACVTGNNTGRGFYYGANGFIVLKSPIGDTRNKLFTTPGTAFFNPSHPNRGDTITFNHGHLCGYGSCHDNTWEVSQRRSYGLIASRAVDVLDGRQPTDLTNGQFWFQFHNRDFPTRTPRFNQYSPAGWDYNKDGVQDTMFVDSCDVQGCVRTWADTLPGRFNNRENNLGSTINAGPFALRAGDTTSFFWAFVGAPDSLSFERLVDQATIAYNSFFLLPKPAPAPRVAYTAVTPADSTDPVVRVGFTTEAYTYRDLFLASYANNLRNNATNDLRILNLLNPGLANQIDARANNGGNLSEILVFKSCNGGTTFTADSDCDGDPLVTQGGSTQGLGWRPYATFQPGAAPVFTDANVIGGRTYLYSFVTKTQGFRTTVLDSIAGQPGRFARELIVVDTTYSALNRNGPTVANVYVPISLAAGGARATATFTPGPGVVANTPITFRFADNVTAGTYRLVFGNRVVITDTLNTVTNVRTAFTVQVQQRDTARVAGSPAASPDTNVIRSSVSYRSPTVPAISAPAAQITTSTVTVGDLRIFTQTITPTGLVPSVGVLLDATGKPYFISTTLATADGFTPADFGNRADFPGFAVFIDQSKLDSLVFERIIEPDGDTVVTAIQTAQGVALNLVETRTTRRNRANGTYDFTFAEDAFGPGAPFRNRGVAQTEAAVRASLDQRCTGTRAAQCTTTDVSQATIDALVAAGVPATRELVATRLPFTVRNTTYGRNVIVAFPRRSAAANTMLIGTTTDSLRLNIADTTWVPGDTLYLLEEFERDSIINGRVQLTAARTPIRVTSRVVTLGPTVLDCTNAANPRIGCNPLALGDRGSVGYYDYAPGTILRVRFQTPFAAGDSISFVVTPRQNAAPVVTKAALKQVRVVPNPFVVQSQFDVVGNTGVGDSRILFTGVPARGSIRVYSVSGQFLQELTWTEADLNGTGDLPYDLRTREGTDLASGLYIFVVKGRGTQGGEEMARGKFVVIR